MPTSFPFIRNKEISTICSFAWMGKFDYFKNSWIIYINIHYSLITPICLYLNGFKSLYVTKATYLIVTEIKIQLLNS